MSVIAWDGKIIAADSQSTAAGARSMARKLERMDNGDIVGFTGDLAKGVLLLHLWKTGLLAMTPDAMHSSAWPAFQRTDDWCRLIVFREGELFFFEQEPIAIPVYAPYVAFGSGRDFALGAMAVGADAVDAVAAACKHSVECGGAIVSFIAYEAPRK